MTAPSTPATCTIAPRWVLILGVSSGIGAATARRLAADGFDIAGVHLDRPSALEAVAEVRAGIEQCGRRAVFFNQNACREENRRQIVSSLKAQLGGRSIYLVLHSIAAGVLRSFLGEGAVKEEDVSRTMQCMGSDIVFWVQALHAEGLLQSPGRVLALTSEGHQRVWPGYGAISAAKAALQALVRQLAVELAPARITANCILAGVTDTPALRRIPGHTQMLLGAQTRNPHARLTRPEDVAALVSLLCDERAAWVSGSVIHCDGAESIRA